MKLNDRLNSSETFNRCSYESVNMLDLALTSEINQEKIRRKLGNFREGNARKSDLRASARLFSVGMGRNQRSADVDVDVALPSPL